MHIDNQKEKSSEFLYGYLTNLYGLFYSFQSSEVSYLEKDCDLSSVFISSKILNSEQEKNYQEYKEELEKQTYFSQTLFLKHRNKSTKVHKKFWKESQESIQKQIVTYYKDEKIKISHILAQGGQGLVLQGSKIVNDAQEKPDTNSDTIGQKGIVLKYLADQEEYQREKTIYQYLQQQQLIAKKEGCRWYAALLDELLFDDQSQTIVLSSGDISLDYFCKQNQVQYLKQNGIEVKNLKGIIDENKQTSVFHLKKFQLVCIFRTILGLMASYERMGLVYQDFKPQNIILHKVGYKRVDYDLYMCDFGGAYFKNKNDYIKYGNVYTQFFRKKELLKRITKCRITNQFQLIFTSDYNDQNIIEDFLYALFRSIQYCMFIEFFDYSGCNAGLEYFKEENLETFISDLSKHSGLKLGEFYQQCLDKKVESFSNLRSLFDFVVMGSPFYQQRTTLQFESSFENQQNSYQIQEFLERELKGKVDKQQNERIIEMADEYYENSMFYEFIFILSMMKDKFVEYVKQRQQFKQRFEQFLRVGQKVGDKKSVQRVSNLVVDLVLYISDQKEEQSSMTILLNLVEWGIQNMDNNNDYDDDGQQQLMQVVEKCVLICRNYYENDLGICIKTYFLASMCYSKSQDLEKGTEFFGEFVRYEMQYEMNVKEIIYKFKRNQEYEIYLNDILQNLQQNIQKQLDKDQQNEYFVQQCNLYLKCIKIMDYLGDLKDQKLQEIVKFCQRIIETVQIQQNIPDFYMCIGQIQEFIMKYSQKHRFQMSLQEFEFLNRDRIYFKDVQYEYKIDYNKEEIETVIELYKKSLQDFEEMDQKEDFLYLQNLFYLGDILKKSNQYKESIYYYEKCLKLTRNQQFVQKNQIRFKLAILYFRIGDYKKSEQQCLEEKEQIEKIHGRSSQQWNEICVSLYIIQFYLGKKETILDNNLNFEEENEVFPLQRYEGMVNIAKLYQRLENNLQAIQFYEIVLKEIEKNNFFYELILLNLGILYYKERKQEQSYNYFTRFINMVFEIRNYEQKVKMYKIQWILESEQKIEEIKAIFPQIQQILDFNSYLKTKEFCIALQKPIQRNFCEVFKKLQNDEEEDLIVDSESLEQEQEQDIQEEELEGSNDDDLISNLLGQLQIQEQNMFDMNLLLDSGNNNNMLGIKTEKKSKKEKVTDIIEDLEENLSFQECFDIFSQKFPLMFTDMEQKNHIFIVLKCVKILFQKYTSYYNSDKIMNLAVNLMEQLSGNEEKEVMYIVFEIKKLLSYQRISISSEQRQIILEKCLLLAERYLISQNNLPLYEIYFESVIMYSYDKNFDKAIMYYEKLEKYDMECTYNIKELICKYTKDFEITDLINQSFDALWDISQFLQSQIEQILEKEPYDKFQLISLYTTLMETFWILFSLYKSNLSRNGINISYWIQFIEQKLEIIEEIGKRTEQLSQILLLLGNIYGKQYQDQKRNQDCDSIVLDKQRIQYMQSIDWKLSDKNNKRIEIYSVSLDNLEQNIEEIQNNMVYMEILFQLGNLLQKENEYQKSITFLRKCLEQGKGKSSKFLEENEIYFKIAFAYYKLEMYEEAYKFGKYEQKIIEQKFGKYSQKWVEITLQLLIIELNFGNGQGIKDQCLNCLQILKILKHQNKIEENSIEYIISISNGARILEYLQEQKEAIYVYQEGIQFTLSKDIEQDREFQFNNISHMGSNFTIQNYLGLDILLNLGVLLHQENYLAESKKKFEELLSMVCSAKLDFSKSDFAFLHRIFSNKNRIQEIIQIYPQIQTVLDFINEKKVKQLEKTFYKIFKSKFNFRKFFGCRQDSGDLSFESLDMPMYQPINFKQDDQDTIIGKIARNGLQSFSKSN